jgi:hypothetical protein
LMRVLADIAVVVDLLTEDHVPSHRRAILR